MERDLLMFRFPYLRLKLWLRSITSSMANIVGKPIHMDKATANAEGLAYARCFIEASATKSLLNPLICK